MNLPLPSLHGAANAVLAYVTPKARVTTISFMATSEVLPKASLILINGKAISRSDQQ